MLETTTFEDVTRIRLSHTLEGRPLYWVACYRVGDVLIDTGCEKTKHELAEYLADDPPRLVLNTHWHEDHVGANRLLAERFGLPALAHPDSAERMKTTPFLHPYQDFVWGLPEPSEARPLPGTVAAGPHTLRPVETPGHAPGHVAFVEETRGWCFSGDIFAREDPKVIRVEEDIPQTVASLAMLRDLPLPRLVLFTSVGKIIPDGREALTRCIDHLTDLAFQARALHRQGLDPDAIMERLFGGEHPFYEHTNQQYSTKNLVKGLLELSA